MVRGGEKGESCYPANMAVYTSVSLSDLRAFWAGIDLGEVESLVGISAGTENSNYLVNLRGGEKFILTLYEQRVKTIDLPFFLSLMQHLSTQGVICPQPVAFRHGGLLGDLCGRKAAVTTFLQGQSLHRWQPVHCNDLGKALAKLHLAARDFAGDRLNTMNISEWRNLTQACLARADEVAEGLSAQLSAEMDYLEEHWPSDLPRGVIHADLFPDNVFFTGDKVSGLIDFYFSCTDFFAYDLAITLNAWCFEDHVAFNITKMRQLLTGYLSARRLSEAELEALPLLCRGAALRFLLTRLYDTLYPKEGHVMRRDPLQYLKRLRFHQQVKSVAEYGIDV